MIQPLSRPQSDIKMTDFTKQVITLVKKIPKGKVATYGQIAALAGKSHAARGVGWILNSCAKPYKLPWQRVINSKGKISFHKSTAEYRNQKRFLQKERVKFTADDSVDLSQFGWKKKARLPSGW